MSRLFGVGAESLPMEELTAGTVQVRMYRKPKDEQYTLVEVESTSNVFRQLLAEKHKKRYRGFEKKPPASIHGLCQFRSAQSKTNFSAIRLTIKPYGNLGF